jgi:hypothetical protein
MRVKILQRNVYYKVAKIEIEIPDSVDEDMIDEYLNSHEELWVDQLRDRINIKDYKYGFGMDTDDNWTDKDQPSEYRYESKLLMVGGHL